MLDCDNTLVLSEELAFEAVADIANELLEEHGFSDRYTADTLLQQFVGQNFRGVLGSLQEKYGFHIPKERQEALVKEEEVRVIAKLEAKARPCQGALEAVADLHKTRKYDLAVVSSSAARRVNASIKKVGLDVFFRENAVFSAASSLSQPTTKPDPAIYYYTMEVLKKQPGECVAVEDSKSGALAAVRAGIPTIGYVGPYPTVEKKKEMAKLLQDTGAKMIMWEWREFPELLGLIERDEYQRVQKWESEWWLIVAAVSVITLPLLRYFWKD